MALTAKSGPTVNYGVTTYASTNGVTGVPADYNDQRGPSLSDLGWGILDPRSAYNYSPGGDVTDVMYGFYNSRGYVDYVPFTAQTSAFIPSTATNTAVTSAYTISASSAVGTYSMSIIAPESGQAVTVIAIDSSAVGVTYNSFGTTGTIRTWAPGGGAGRCISITTSSSGDLGNWSIYGRDVYGYKISETLGITDGTSGGAAGYTIISRKAYKYISTIINATTPISTGVRIGYTDRFGVPLFVPYAGMDIDVRLLASAYSSAVAVALSTTNFTLGSTVTQTSTTPDVRGIFTSTTATDGTLRLQIRVTPSASAVAAVTSTDVSPLFGVAQYSA